MAAVAMSFMASLWVVFPMSMVMMVMVMGRCGRLFFIVMMMVRFCGHNTSCLFIGRDIGLDLLVFGRPATLDIG